MIQPPIFKYDDVLRPQVFIGFDDRQPKAYEVCKHSILKNTSGPVDVYPLEHKDLRRKGLFIREWIVDGETGVLKDLIDDLPFSNQFSHTRFLVPEYAKWLGINQQLLMFVDLDFVFFGDVYKLFNECTGDKTVWCVHHDYNPNKTEKMDFQVQTSYPKKLWSSLMIFNQKKKQLSLYDVNTMKSSDLHRLNWVPDSEIGKIDESWNFIPEHSENRTNQINAIHYTEGLPNLPGYKTSKFSQYYTALEREINV